MQVEANFPDKLQCLFEPAPYKVLYGGRGGAKSWSAARALLLIGVQKPLRVLCVREFQSSIKESVHKLLADQIQLLGLSNYYEIMDKTIRGPNGTEFNFEGLHRNFQKIKSYEGIDVCWAEEAANISKASWEYLEPTIRKEGSEIWVVFNPELETDETYQRFVKNPPSGAIVVEVSWRDNFWFTSRMKQKMEDLKEKDYDAYLNVWEGKCKVLLDGAVYMQELREARAQSRITRVPYDRVASVSTFWDLGWADYTCIWFAQKVGFETRVIDFYQNQHQTLDHYLEVLQRRGYIYDTHWLPHDADSKELRTGKSIKQLCRAKGFHAQIVPKLSLVNGINAVRTIFPNTFIDEKRCAEGLQALYHYRYEVVDDKGTRSRVPVHDQASHGADAFRYLAVALKQPGHARDNVLKALKAPAETLESPEFEFGDYVFADEQHGWMSR